jgi:hypothetical protein
LGVRSSDELLRQCERRTAKRSAACEIFWTLGANQVGKAAIQGWRDLLAPAVGSRAISIWPFDGDFSVLLASAGITVLETYPAETYGHLGFARGFGKRTNEGRASQAGPVISWCDRNAVVLRAELIAQIEDGFGHSETGEDTFDAFIGLLGMIEAVCDPLRCVAPHDSVVQDVEGWIFGADPASMNAMPVSPARVRRKPTTELHRPWPIDNVPAASDRERLCPACQKKRFSRWPWGWDSHAAHACTGITGDTPEERKRVYRERHLS